MGFLMDYINLGLKNRELELLEQISAQNRETHGFSKRQFEWDDPIFVKAADAIDDAFYAPHPEISKEMRSKKRFFPTKSKAVGMIDRLANEGKLSALEYLTLYAEILTPLKEIEDRSSLKTSA